MPWSPTGAITPALFFLDVDAARGERAEVDMPSGVGGSRDRWLGLRRRRRRRLLWVRWRGR
jgi:hypothetical protein